MQTYWASESQERIGKELMGKVEAFDQYLLTSGMMRELKKSYNTYYGQADIGSAGERGELSTIQVNHYRNLVQHLLVMITSQRPAWEPQASSTDVKALSQTILAGSLLDYYMREKRVERSLLKATETALFLREGWVACTWQTNAGEVYGVTESGAPIYEGDIEVSTYKLNDVIRDVTRLDCEHDWLIVRSFKNKFDLCAKYPDLAEQIVSVTGSKSVMERFNSRDSYKKSETDQIPVYTLYHSKTPSIPEGRIVEFVTDEIITIDGPLPYRKVPVFRISPSDQLETAFGCTPTLDLLSVQDAIDSLYSTALTNNNAFGVQNITSPKGNDISVQQMAGGLNLIEYAKEPPQPLQMTATAPETYNFIDRLERVAESLSGVNSVARGNAPASLSGAAMALIQSTAIQFASGLQQSYTSILEDVGTSILNTLADFAVTPRVANIVGKSGKGMLKEFKNTDISEVSRVTVDSGNALTKTAAGRVEIANQLLANNMIQNPNQYIMVLTTGKLEPVYENEQRQLLLIRAENEALQDGKTVRALATDQHSEHILEHASVLSSPEAREDPNAPLVVNSLAHIQEHLELLRNTDPALLALLNQQQIPPVAPPAGVPAVMNGTNPVTQQAAEVNMPNMPVDPMTGSTFNPNQ